MITLKNYSKFVVFVEDSMLLALNKISENKSRIIFAVNSLGHLGRRVDRWRCSALADRHKRNRSRSASFESDESTNS